MFTSKSQALYSIASEAAKNPFLKVWTINTIIPLLYSVYHTNLPPPHDRSGGSLCCVLLPA